MSAPKAGGRVDLAIACNGNRYPIELRIRRKPASKNPEVRQLLRLMDRMGVKSGWIVLFNPNKTATWEEKFWDHTKVIAGKTIRIYGCQENAEAVSLPRQQSEKEIPATTIQIQMRRNVYY